MSSHNSLSIQDGSRLTVGSKLLQEVCSSYGKPSVSCGTGRRLCMRTFDRDHTKCTKAFHKHCTGASAELKDSLHPS